MLERGQIRCCVPETGRISISERTYEIGRRKSIGATDAEIFGQFLIEAVSLSLVGSLFGSAHGITSKGEDRRGVLRVTAGTLRRCRVSRGPRSC
jgi:hypothetical protein